MRLGFTLVEVITAITLTAIVLGIAAAALSAATNARDVVEAHQRSLESESRLQSMLTDMLRHAPPADAANEPLLQITRDGSNRVSLVFLSTGVREPFGTGEIWRVTLAHVGTRLSWRAEPVRSVAGVSQLRAEIDGVETLDVRVLEPERAGESAAWRSDWPVLQARPALVEVLLNRSGSSGGARSTNVRTRAATWTIALDPLEANR